MSDIQTLDIGQERRPSKAQTKSRRSFPPLLDGTAPTTKTPSFE
jgi:hypothetical protein